MSCATNLTAYRNADYVMNTTFPVGFAFFGATIKMQVREYAGAPTALLTVSDVASVNGSVFVFIGNRINLLVKKADLQLLPEANPVSDPYVGVYDIIITDTDGVENYLFGGFFILQQGVTE